LKHSHLACLVTRTPIILMPMPPPHIVVDISTIDPLYRIYLHHVLMAHTEDTIMVHDPALRVVDDEDHIGGGPAALEVLS
jgi:hypothetical protein